MSPGRYFLELVGLACVLALTASLVRFGKPHTAAHPRAVITEADAGSLWHVPLPGGNYTYVDLREQGKLHVPNREGTWMNRIGRLDARLGERPLALDDAICLVHDYAHAAGPPTVTTTTREGFGNHTLWLFRSPGVAGYLEVRPDGSYWMPQSYGRWRRQGDAFVLENDAGACHELRLSEDGSACRGTRRETCLLLCPDYTRSGEGGRALRLPGDPQAFASSVR